MTANEWLYDGRHILKKLKDGADFVDGHALLSLNQYRERLINEKLNLGMDMNPIYFQRHLVSLAPVTFSDLPEADAPLSSRKISASDIPAIIGTDDTTFKVYGSSGHRRAIRMDQEKISMIAEYPPDDYDKFEFYYISGTRIYYYPKTDHITVNGIFSDPFQIYTTKALVINGVTESAAGVKRLNTIYDTYPFDLEGMTYALKLFISEKFGVSMNIIEDYIADNEDQLKIIKSGQK